MTAIRVERHDSELGRWILAHWQPPRLARVVGGIWYFEGMLAHPRERHFPNGRLELVVHLGPPYRQVVGDRCQGFAPVCLSGLLVGPEVIEAPPGPTAVLGVRLRPAGAFALLGRPLHRLTGLSVDLEEIVPAAAREFADRCAAAVDPVARIQAAAAWLERRIRAGPGADRAVTWMADQIERRRGAVSIAALRERTGWSKTRLTRVFREQLGVAPKTLARVVRFRSALEMVGRGDHPLSRVALDAGYYDQPHFNAEFRELSGFAPGDYRTRLRFPDSVNLAER